MKVTKQLFVVILMMGLLMSACKNNNKKSGFVPPKAAHEVVVKEQIQTSNYTYFRVSEGDKEFWIAGVKMEAKVGEKLYYNTYYEMPDFKSTELDRTFDEVLFIQDLSKTPTVSTQSGAPTGGMQMGTPRDENPMGGHGAEGGNEPTTVESVSKEGLEVVDQVLDLQNLLANPKDYAEKLVKISGKVTKVNPAIMGINWVHISPVSGENASLDFTITTHETVKVDEEVTFEGKITLNKDFGAGYFYSIIMEEGEVVK